MRDDVSALDLLARARQGDRRALGELLEAQRADLRRRATLRLDGRMAVRMDASDIIQLTFLEAHRAIAEFRGADERALQAWLEKILERNLANALRDHLYLKKRNLRREQSMDDSHGTLAPLKQELGAEDSSPSHRAMRGEEEEQLFRALETLPADQRLAVRLRHLENWPLMDIAQNLGRSPAATAGLIKRGLQALRRRLHAGQ